MASGQLNVIGGNDRGKRFDLSLPETRVGRGADQDVVLSDIAVSRRHITVHAEGGRYRLRDLGSGNGTIVNGQRIDTVILNDGDHIEIGNTVLRFNQAGLSQSAPPPAAAPPPSYGAPPPSYPSSAGAGAPPPAYPSSAGNFAPPPLAPVSAAPAFPAPSYEGAPAAPQVIAAPEQQRPLQGAATQAPFMVGSATVAPQPGPAMPMPQRTIARPMAVGKRATAAPRGPLDTTGKKVLVFGGMGLLCMIGGGVIVSRTVFAKPQVVPAEAEETYRQGMRLFASGDYDGAKIVFNEAVTQAPDAPEPKRYVKQCDIELRARTSLKAAERALAGRHYGDALRAAGEVDENSLAYDQARRMRKDLTPRAASEAVDDARRLMSTDPTAAQTRLQAALELDPNNADARALASGKLKLKMPPAAVAAKEPPAAAPKEQAAPPPEHHSTKAPKEDIPLVKAPKPGKEPKEASLPSASNLADSKGAMAAYKNKDFGGAEKAARLESMSQPMKQAEKLLALANQIKLVRTAYDKAAAEEASRPEDAVKDYTEAMNLDAKLGKGMHGSFFRSKIGKTELGAAQSLFNAGKYDQCWAIVQRAQKSGAGDGGLPKQLETKAGELIQKGQAIQKSNLNQAKTYYRMVIKMVPTGSPSYSKAYVLLNNASGAHKDEDED